MCSATGVPSHIANSVWSSTRPGRGDEDIEPGAVHHQVGDHLRELVGRENDQHVGARVWPARRVAEGLDLDLALLPSAAHTPSQRPGACRIVVDVA